MDNNKKFTPFSVQHILGLKTKEEKQNQGRLVVIIKRGSRQTYQKSQLKRLEAFFSENHYPQKEDRARLARELGLETNKVKVWFQNRRSKWKKEEKIAPEVAAEERKASAAAARRKANGANFRKFTRDGFRKILTARGVYFEPTQQATAGEAK